MLQSLHPGKTRSPPSALGWNDPTVILWLARTYEAVPISGWRYMDRRLKRTELTYRSIVALFTIAPVLNRHQKLPLGKWRCAHI